MNRPIIFICHSLGGIVCKKVYLQSSLYRTTNWFSNTFKALILAKTKPYYENIFEKTQAILFFVSPLDSSLRSLWTYDCTQGCPHRGSRVASWATVMSNFINTCTFHQPLRKQLLGDLSLSSNILADISVAFKFIATNLQIKTFYETEAMSPLKGPVRLSPVRLPLRKLIVASVFMLK